MDLSPSFLRVQECCCLTPPEDLSFLRGDSDHWISAALSCYIMYCSKMPWDEIYTESCRGQSLDELCLQWVPSSWDKLGSRISHFPSSWRPNTRTDPPHPFSQHWLDFMAHVHIAQRPSWSLGSNSIRWVKKGASAPLAELCWTCLSWKSLFAYFTIATEIWLIPGWGMTCSFLAHISKFA